MKFIIMKAMKVIYWALGTSKFSTKTEFGEHILLQPKKLFKWFSSSNSFQDFIKKLNYFKEVV